MSRAITATPIAPREMYCIFSLNVVRVVRVFSMAVISTEEKTDQVASGIPPDRFD
jgi:hypothetical protein